jgi:hypothetical protein
MEILHNEKLDDLDPSPSIIRVIRLSRMRWAGHVICMEGVGRSIQEFYGEI